MAASLNQLQLIGTVTRDVDLKYTNSDLAIAEVGIAINERRKKGDEWIDETTFVDITYFGRLAEVCGEYVRKGMSIYCGGKLKLDAWEQDGQRRQKLKVIGDSMQMLGGKMREEEAF